MVRFLNVNGLMPPDQSAYRNGHSTKTAILKVLSDVVDEIANDRVTLLSLLDLSAALDAVDHQILIRRLETSYGLSLLRMKSYLADTTQSLWCNDHLSTKRHVHHCVPHGSVLGPLLSIFYTADISRISKVFGLTSHSYAQLCRRCADLFFLSVHGHGATTDVFL